MGKARREQAIAVQLLQTFEMEAKAILARCAQAKRDVAGFSFTRYRAFFETVKSFLVLAAFTRSKIEMLNVSPAEQRHLLEHIDGLDRRVSRAAMDVANVFYRLMLRRDMVYLGGHERCSEHREMLRDMLEREAEKTAGQTSDPHLVRDATALDAVLQEIVRRTPPMRELQAGSLAA